MKTIPICEYASSGCNSPEGECLGVCCADSRGHSATTETQARAGDPEVVAWRRPSLACGASFTERFADVVAWAALGDFYDELITLQSHREAMVVITSKWTAESEEVQKLLLKLEDSGRAIAKKDAALKVCEELGRAVLAKIRRDAPDLSGKLIGEFDAAISQAQEALK